MKRVIMAAVLAAFAWAPAALGAEADARLVANQDYPPAFPRAGPRLVLDNPWGAAWDVVYPPGQPTPMHRHGLDSVGVELADSSVTVTTPDGAAQSFPSRRGESYYMPRGTTHIEVTPAGFAPRHAVIIELKDGVPAAPAPGPDLAAPAAQKVAESPRVILWNYAWPASPGAAVRLAHNAFIVVIDGGRLTDAGPDGTRRTQAVTSGQVLFRPAGAVLSEVAAEGPVRAVVAELK